MTTPVISVDELRRVRAAAAPPVLLDVRWALGRDDGRDQYLAAHIPGAVFVDLEAELAAEPQPALGRHPLPALGDLQQAARRWGINANSEVVAYDASGNLAAARAWWLLRWAGLTEVRLLDGGLQAWSAAGLATSSGEELPESQGNVVLRDDALPTLTPDQAAALAADGLLLDVRAAERYSGEYEPVDPRAGHIPGARSWPTVGNLDTSGRFAHNETLRRRFAALGVDSGTTVGVYCGSGVTAAHAIAALAIAGVDGVLYPGSWSQWSSDSDRPVAVGLDAR